MKSFTVFVGCVLFLCIENSLQQDLNKSNDQKLPIPLMLHRLRRQTQESVDQDLCTIFGVCNGPVPNNQPTPRPLATTPTSNNNNQVPTSSTPQPDPVADESYNRCINMCQAIPTYNPVCGSDGNTYDNAGKLRCAGPCGRPNVSQLRLGAC